MGANKDFKPIIAELREQGWEVERTGQGHWRATPPNRNHSIVHFSQSDDHHAIHNTIKDLKRSGFIWPPPSKKEQASDRRANGASSSSPDELIAEIHSQLGVEESPATSPSHNKPAESHEERMDRLFHELKDAKTFLTLTEEHLVECKRKLEDAQRAFAEAQVERDKAAETLKLKKVEFDEAFSSAA